jgi:hypothetical protein
MLMKKKRQATTKALVKAPSKVGLSLTQKRALTALSEEPNINRACKEADISRQTLRLWLRTIPSFAQQYNELLSSYGDEARAQLASLLPKAGEAFERALDATQPFEVEVTCPKCGETFKEEVQVPAWNTVVKVAENVFKQHGQLTTKVEGTVSGQVTHLHMTTEDMLQLEKIRRYGLTAVPPEIRQSLSERGFLEDVTEGEFREVGSEE